MPIAKFVVIYPRPTDIEAFERVYKNEHLPLAAAKLAGKTKYVGTKILASPQGTPPFHRIAEIHFPSLQSLQACATSPGGEETIAHAITISTGGAPIFLIADEETIEF
ncbi:MAG: EthD family reductase [Methylovirgula sp.]